MNKVKKLVLTSIIVLSVNNVYSQMDRLFNWEKDDVKGAVKSYTELTYEVEKGASKNNKISKGDLYFHQIFKYDDLGNFIELTNYDENKKLVGTHYNEYDENRNMITQLFYDDSIKAVTSNKYDKKGNLIEFTNDTGSAFFFKYDEKGNRIEILNEPDDPIFPESRQTYEYNLEGNMIESIWYQSTDMRRKYFYKHDTRGNKIEEIQYIFEEGLSYVKIIYAYDDYNNMVAQTEYNEEDILQNKISFTYSYDEKGNWTEKIEFRNETPLYIAERQYEYSK